MTGFTVRCIHPSPLGDLLLVGVKETPDLVRLLAIHLPDERHPRAPDPTSAEDPAALQPARTALDAYFGGDLREFDLPLEPRGTPFQRLVWEEIARIPFGSTISYGELARRTGRPGAARAVGAAAGANPIPIVVPCHRVVGSGGALTGYAGGLDRKAWLLDHERRVTSR